LSFNAHRRAHASTDVAARVDPTLEHDRTLFCARVPAYTARRRGDATVRRALQRQRDHRVHAHRSMPHVIEAATSARAKCRGCGQRIDKGVLRLGERLPNVFGEGEMTLWFHIPCAACKRPQVFLDTVQEGVESIDDRERLEQIARRGIEHRRLPRIDGMQRAPTGRARCRSCRELIEPATWRIPLVYYEEGRFEPSGYIHLRCAPGYFETAEVMDHLRQFAPDLSAEDLAEIRAAL
jgi:Poly(ADP-ribose) polymerase and DNA-Ligase Zn-finger region